MVETTAAEFTQMAKVSGIPARLLSQVDWARDGQNVDGNLVVTLSDGSEIIVRNYFKSGGVTAVVLPDGTVIAGPAAAAWVVTLEASYDENSAVQDVKKAGVSLPVMPFVQSATAVRTEKTTRRSPGRNLILVSMSLKRPQVLHRHRRTAQRPARPIAAVNCQRQRQRIRASTSNPSRTWDFPPNPAAPARKRRAAAARTGSIATNGGPVHVRWNRRFWWCRKQ